jgi:regulator of protease activity HflC (stomatin/prohibitin superfamily)
MASTGEKFGGCGIKRVNATAIIKPIKTVRPAENGEVVRFGIKHSRQKKAISNRIPYSAAFEMVKRAVTARNF